jgi:hypothetical protein
LLTRYLKLRDGPGRVGSLETEIAFEILQSIAVQRLQKSPELQPERTLSGYLGDPRPLGSNFNDLLASGVCAAATPASVIARNSEIRTNTML